MKTKTKETLCSYVCDPIVALAIVLFIFTGGIVYGSHMMSEYDQAIVDEANKIITEHKCSKEMNNEN